MFSLSLNRRDPSIPGPETTAVAPECGYKTREMGGGREDARPRAGEYGRTEGEGGSGNEERVGNRPNRKVKREKIGAGAGEPGPTRRRAGKTEVDRSNPYQLIMITEARQTNCNLIG